MSDREPTLDDVLAEIAKLRIDTMGRMDRLQDTATQQSRDIAALLDLMAAGLRAADEGREGVRRAHDIGASNTSVLTDLLKRVRRLETDVRELRDKGEP
jgi:hypothetical protein